MLTTSSTRLRSNLAADGAHAPRGGDARTLYLGQSTCQRVDATIDSLVVSAKRTDEPLRQLRFPLQRVARVVSSTAVDWSGKALHLCLQRNLSICWLDSNGDAMGSLYSNNAQPSSFASALDLMLETTEGLERYQHWLKSRRMQVQLQWGRSSPRPIPPQQWEATKRSWVYLAKLDTAHLPTTLHGLLAGCVAQQLQEHRIAPIQQGPDGTPLLLAQDLTWLLWAEMNFCSGALADHAEGGQEVTLLLERWQACNGSALLLHLDSLRRAANKELHP